jgi:uncharacterized protein YkwD
MSHRIARFITGLTLTSLLALAPTSTSRAETSREPQLAASPYDLINAVNALRASYGLAPYSISSFLMSVAQGHADFMAATSHVSHTGIGGSSVTDRLLAAGYPLAGDLSLGGFRSENITSGSEGTSAQSAVNQWTGDAPHLNTMISSNLTEIGAGVSVNGGRVYFVIDCARPTNSGIPQTAGAPIGSGSAVPPGGGVIIPVVVVTPNADGDVIHEVKAGQTLWQIAISYETKIDELQRLNNLFDNNIYPGNKLLIKKDVIGTPTIPAETPTLAVTSSPTSLPTSKATIIAPTLTFTPGDGMTSASRNNTMGIAMGIIALALLGGGVVAWLGNSKNNSK